MARGSRGANRRLNSKERQKIRNRLYAERTICKCGKLMWLPEVLYPDGRPAGEPIRDDVATLDHIIPRSRGGSNAVSNFEIMCFECNNRKGNVTPHEHLYTKPPPARINGLRGTPAKTHVPNEPNGARCHISLRAGSSGSTRYCHACKVRRNACQVEA